MIGGVKEGGHGVHMQARLAIVMSATALVVAILGITPIGGAAGNAVATGVAKVTGSKAAGPFAKRGPRGPRGPRGARGPIGARGAQGSAGPQGVAGPEGARGPTGPAGSPDTPAQVLEKSKQVDGSGSGLDADALDGVDSSAFGRVAMVVGSCCGTAIESSLPSTVIQVTVQVPGGQPQRVLVEADFTTRRYQFSTGSCTPCNYGFRLVENGVGTIESYGYGSLESNNDHEPMQLSRLFTASPGTHTYNLDLTFLSNPVANPEIVEIMHPRLRATVYPFSAG